MVINPESNLTENIGNKAKGLIFLKKENLPTPDFVIIKLNDLIANYEDISAQLKKLFEKKDFAAIENIFQNLNWQEENLKRDFETALALPGRQFSFRTSATMEDLSLHSFAGLYETYLNIELNPENFKKYLRLCWHSIFTERIYNYCQKESISTLEMDFSVIVQIMIQAKISGIAFASYPLAGSRLVFNYGSGENIVQGGLAKEIFFSDQIEIPSEFISNGLEKQFSSLISYLEAIAYLKSGESDIEWCINESGVYLLQIRPVTKHLSRGANQELIFDCTNLEESYPGVITPLTYSFIRFAYSKVYAHFLSLVGVKEKIIRQNQLITDNMLGCIQGRAYYRIINWYKMIALIPGYRYNKEFFEAMLLPKKKLTVEKANQKSFFQFIGQIPLIIRMGSQLLFYKKIHARFQKNFELKNQPHEAAKLEAMSPIDLVNSYLQLEKDFLDDWKMPILNDFRLMIFHGLLKKIIDKAISQGQQNYLNEMISSFFNRAELNTIKELKNLADEIDIKSELQKIFQDENSKNIYTNILKNDTEDARKFKEKINQYLKNFGARRPDELKLESLGLQDQPELIINLIKNYREIKINGRLEPRKNLWPEIKKIITQGEKYSIKKHLYFSLIVFLSHYTKEAIANREKFRFKRGVAYGMARDYFLALGKKFAEAEVIAEKNDVFFLTREEIINLSQNNIFEDDFRPIVQIRKTKYQKYESADEPAKRLKMTGVGHRAQIISDMEPANPTRIISGIPTSPGIVRAPVIVLKKFDPNANIKGKILVTYQTDPGWSLIFPLLKGIILEKGNTLSHAAILSRELNIPSVVKAEGVINSLRNGAIVELDGQTGIIKIISE